MTDKLGFLSFGDAANEDQSLILYRTRDGAKSWVQVAVTLPDEVERSSATAADVYQGDGFLLLCVLMQHESANASFAYLTSTDEGQSWEFYRTYER